MLRMDKKLSSGVRKARVEEILKQVRVRWVHSAVSVYAEVNFREKVWSHFIFILVKLPFDDLSFLSVMKLKSFKIFSE